MNRIVFKPLNWALLLSLITVLAACSTTSTPQARETAPFYIATVDIDASATEAQLIERYGGEIISFKPEAGFAILGFSQKEGELTTLTTTSNIDAMQTGVNASGYSAWASGHSAWASGWSAWAGGWSAWAGGWRAWAGSQDMEADGSNRKAWDLINLEEAHSISRNFGKGMTVAVLDTGFDLDHPMFQGRLAPSARWKDFVGNDAIPEEVNGTMKGHGTAAAGIILRIAPQAKILPIRVLRGDGKGDLDTIIQAIEYAVNKGANVISLSLGTTQDSIALYQMAKWANDQGVYIVASAGNEASTNGILYPGAYSWTSGTYGKTIGISSIDNDKELSPFSNTGGGMFAAAPGRNIASSAVGGKVGAFTGTSFAAPMYSGALALALSDMPAGSSPFDLKNWGSLTFNDGFRRINVAKLIRSIPNWTEPEYNIVNVKSGMCLVVQKGSLDNGANIQQTGCTGADKKTFKFQTTDTENHFKIVNVNSGKVIDGTGQTAVNSNVRQWSFTNVDQQKWRLEATGTAFNIIAKDSGLCMTVAGGSMNNGANLEQTTCGNGNAQKFRLVLMN